jgi:hypothetical protein
MKKSIWEKRPEILIEYDSIQREYYEKKISGVFTSSGEGN